MNVSKLIIASVSILLLGSCDSKKLDKHGFTIIYSTTNCSKSYRPIELEKLLDAPPKYNDLPVEVSGYYIIGLEESYLALYPPGPKNNSGNLIWVDFHSKLFRIENRDTIYLFQGNEYRNLSFKKVKLRGIFVGHKYVNGAALLRDVCYLEVSESF